jgi:sulfotransferase
MEKTVHFLGGLPRSGNTLLSALLNQNPRIYSTPLSPLPTLMWDYVNSCNPMEQINRNKENEKRALKVLSSFHENFYKDVDEPIIINREKDWGTPSNLDLIKRFITPTPKIIVTVRDILEIIASFVSMDADYLKNNTINSNAFINNYRSPQDSIVEYLMRPNGEIDKSLLAISSAFYPENKGIFHIVEYNDLVLKPEETMSGIYKFLGLNDYKHDFNKIKKVESDNDMAVGLPKNLHDIRKSISRSSTSTDILSDYIKHKYSNMEFWRENSLMKVRGKDF